MVEEVQGHVAVYQVLELTLLKTKLVLTLSVKSFLVEGHIEQQRSFSCLTRIWLLSFTFTKSLTWFLT